VSAILVAAAALGCLAAALLEQARRGVGARLAGWRRRCSAARVFGAARLGFGGGAAGD